MAVAIRPVYSYPSLESSVLYPLGIWASMGNDVNVPDGLRDNLGVIGVGVTDDWSEIEPHEDEFHWNRIDQRIDNVIAAGFDNIAIAVTDSQFDTPDWLLDQLVGLDEILYVLDPAEQHNTFCEQLRIPFWWSALWLERRKNLRQKCAERYGNDSRIKATFCSILNHNSMDWNNIDFVGTIHCGSHGITGDHTVDYIADWLEAGWTRGLVREMGKDLIAFTASVWPTQALKLPIGGLGTTDDTRLATAGGEPDPEGGPGNYTTLAREIVSWIGDQSFSNRVFISRNTFAATSPDRQHLIDNPPAITSERYLFQMVLDAGRQAGLQTVAAASICVCDGVSECRQNGGPCSGGQAGQNQVMQDSLDSMLTYGGSFIEPWVLDAENTNFYDMMRDATIAMGGTPRS